MNPLSLTGAFIISFALLSYGVSSISIQRFRLITPSVLIALTLGVLLDITAVGFMIAGSGLLPISLHGFLGFVVMLTMKAWKIGGRRNWGPSVDLWDAGAFGMMT